MICPPCADRACPDCQTLSCTCGHDGSPVRALTASERHAVVLGHATGNVRLREATP